MYTRLQLNFYPTIMFSLYSPLLGRSYANRYNIQNNVSQASFSNGNGTTIMNY